MGGERTYSDLALRTAVADARSWRGVLRSLGLAATSAAALRSVRRRADALGVDYSHFSGNRRWTDDDLATAVSTEQTWRGVAEALGLTGGSSITTVKGHARRLGLTTTHLDRPEINRPGAARHFEPDLVHLSRAGPLLAAAWFTLCGHDVSWPLEPCRYDLLVRTGSRHERVQVKTTTVRSGDSWTAWLSTTGRQRTPYDPDDIDSFFVIDGDLAYYLIPVAVVGGLHAITLSSYEEYCVCRPLG